MGYTITEKLLMKAAGVDSVKPGQLVLANLDMVLGNDITTPVAIKALEDHNVDTVFDNKKISIVLDHFAPNKDIKAAEQCKQCRDFANKHGIVNFYDVGYMGVEHALLPEKGIVKTSDVIIGADSHTCTYGALGAFSTGIGSTDMAMGIATGKAWLKIPSQIKIVLSGKLNKYVSGKDLILHLIGILGVDGATYKTLEFTGEGVKSLKMDDRFSICNMAIECGAKNGIFAYDEITAEYEKGRVTAPFTPFYSDEDAKYEKVININLSELKPTVSFPSLPSNTHTLPLSEKVKVDQVYIGSCTNGRLSDIEKAVSVIGSHKVHKGVRLIVVPATQQVYLDCVKLGYVEKIINAGGVVSTPTCGACLGGFMGVLAHGEVCISTTNRNFVGRMGDTTSKIYLANPEVAMASAINGYISSPEEL
ncbi:MAG: 3-isopropylmalate dehydratase large subunit [Clostridia bacterium]|nr:3-isopropylmalate dehydratase large subunit [Clostridia bacterium]